MVKQLIFSSVIVVLLLCSLFAAFAFTSISTDSVYAQLLSFKKTNNTSTNNTSTNNISALERTGPSQFKGVTPISPADLPREAREQPVPLTPPK